jgi:DNA-binding CsgD family transcriptional regulator
MRSVTVAGTRASAARDAIAALCEHGLDPAELLQEVESRMRPIVPHDTGAWWTTDPETLLPTVLGVSEPPSYSEALFSPEDYDVFDGLDRASRDTALEPHALRVLSRSGHATWAAGRFTRAPDLPRFTKAEADYLAAVGRYVGAGVREYLSQTPWSDGPSRVPGVLVVSAEERIDDATPEARKWLSRLSPHEPGLLPASLRGLVRQNRAKRVGHSPLRPSKVRIRMPEGDWVIARATSFTIDESRSAVLVRAATRADMKAITLALHSLTARERQISELLLDGLDPREVSAQLNISIHTVRGYVKAVFAKFGVSSRGELTAYLGS